MSIWLIAFITLIYLGVTVSLGMDGRWGLAIAYAGWAVGNVGIILDLYR